MIDSKWIQGYCTAPKISNSSEKIAAKEHYLPSLIIPNDSKVKSIDLSSIIGNWFFDGGLLSSIPRLPTEVYVWSPIETTT